MPEFNRVYDDLLERFGADQIDIVKLNGFEMPHIAQQFGIPYYPFFIYVAPGTESC